jgi:hypothetical protein
MPNVWVWGANGRRVSQGRFESSDVERFAWVLMERFGWILMEV